MAATITHKASVTSGTNATSYATGSWTPTANRLALCTVQNELSGTPSEPTTLTGNTITYVKAAGYLDDTSGTQSRITTYIGLTGVAPSAGAVTADFGVETELGCNIVVEEVDGGYILGLRRDCTKQNRNGQRVRNIRDDYTGRRYHGGQCVLWRIPSSSRRNIYRRFGVYTVR